jgi:hypothetical protein
MCLVWLRKYSSGSSIWNLTAFTPAVEQIQAGTREI